MEEVKENTDVNRLEIFIAAMIALLSISTASTAYFSHMEDSNSTHNYFSSQSIIVEANSLYLEANQAIMYDMNSYDSFLIALNDGNESLAEFYFSGLSQSAIDSDNRTSGPFDDQYYEEMYAFASQREAEGQELADKAAEQNDAADEYQLAVLFSAVGLSLTGWASVISSHKLKLTFLTCSVVALLISVIQASSV
ncbi:MAG: hypothetical protein VYE32_03035 [Candidatus Thermoplasmatota archaeon]|nr:hypothetical protein [Candidatus Thermoplasmatota archaeon]